MIGIIVVHLPFVGSLYLIVDSVDIKSLMTTGILGFMTFLTIITRRHYPEIFFGMVICSIIIQVIFISYPTTAWFVIPLAVFEVARRCLVQAAQVCLGIALMLSAIAPIRWANGAYFDSADLRSVAILISVSMACAVTSAYSIGRRGYEVDSARSRQLIAEMETAQLMIAEQAARQDTLESQIRTNIARELHDVVAHSIAVMVVQAEGGLAQAQHGSSTPTHALNTIADTGREALREMRNIVRTLRSDDRVPEVSSVPSLAELPSLTEKAHATLTVSGTPHKSTPTIEMTIYRVIQEALTNSLKHAGPDADPHVNLAWFPAYVSVTITNDLSAGGTMDDQRGSGLIGMAERVQALDGTLIVGPTDEGGFKVCAKIPLSTQSSE